jgi:hypothetical protein
MSDQPGRDFFTRLRKLHFNQVAAAVRLAAAQAGPAARAKAVLAALGLEGVMVIPMPGGHVQVLCPYRGCVDYYPDGRQEESLEAAEEINRWAVWRMKALVNKAFPGLPPGTLVVE